MGRRKEIPVRIKLAILIRQKGKCAATGEDFTFKQALNSEIQFDHDPPLALRDFVNELNDTYPTANDPDFIFAVLKSAHEERTFKRRGARRGDIAELKHERAVGKAQRRHLERMELKRHGKKPPKSGAIPSRPFPKRKP